VWAVGVGGDAVNVGEGVSGGWVEASQPGQKDSHRDFMAGVEGKEDWIRNQRGLCRPAVLGWCFRPGTEAWTSGARSIAARCQIGVGSRQEHMF
jgi:hypothetical protein